MIKSSIIVILFISYIKGLFVIVYVQSKPFKGIRIIKKSNQYITSIDSQSFDEIKRFRYGQTHHNNTLKTVPVISMSFEDVSLPQSIKVNHLFINQKNKEISIPLYMNIIMTVKSMDDISQLNTPCIYLGRGKQKSSYSTQKRQNSCIECSYQADQSEYNGKNVQKSIRACTNKQETNQYFNKWLKIKAFKQTIQAKQTAHEGQAHIYLKSFYKILLVLVFITIMVIKFEFHQPNKDFADI